MVPEVQASGPIIDNIQRRPDGTYVVAYNGFPYHATPDATPDVYELVVEMIEDGAEVIDYVGPEVAQPSPEEVAIGEYTRRRAIADTRIAPLQDAVDLDDASAQEVAALKAWKQYRVALSRVAGQPGYPDAVEWPVAPE